jgi:glycosyltransferase involved in cell wall biosynthesis
MHSWRFMRGEVTMKVVQYYDRFKPLIGGVETHIENIIQSPNIEFEVITNAIPDQPLKQIYSKNATIRRFTPYDRTNYPYKNKTKSRMSFPYRVMTDVIRNNNKIKYLKKSKFDILHVHGPALSMNLQRIDGWIKKPILTRNIPFNSITKTKILTMHGLFSPYTSNPFAEKYEKNLVMSFDRVICVDEIVQKKVISYGHTNTILLPNAVDTTTYSFQPLKDTKMLKVGFVGRLDKDRGLEYLEELITIQPKFIELHIAGSVNSHMLDRFNRKHTDAKIIFHSNVPNEKMPEFYKNIDILFNPVIVEGISRVTLEAMACGRPVIMLDRGNRYPVINGKTGYLVTQSISDIVALLDDIQNNKETLPTIAENARKIVEKEYSNKVIIPKIEKIYENL